MNDYIQSLRIELEPLVRSQLRQELLDQIRQEMKPIVRNELMDEFVNSGQLLEEWRRMLSEQAATFRKEIEPAIRSRVELELAEALRPQIEREVREKVEQQYTEYVEQLMRQRQNSSLLEYFSVDQVESTRTEAINQLKAELHSSVTDSLRSELSVSVRDSLYEKLKPVVMQSPDLRNEVRKALTNTMRDEVRRGLMQTMREEVSVDLRNSMRPQIEGSIRTELTLPMVELIANDRDGSLAAALQLSRFHLEKSLREQLQNEANRHSVNLLAEWLWARSNLQEGQIQELISQARNELEPSSEVSSRRPDGFYRAMDTVACHSTGEVIKVGEFFIQVAGEAYKLPVSYEQSEQLAKRWYYAQSPRPAGGLPEQVLQDQCHSEQNEIQI